MADANPSESHSDREAGDPEPVTALSTFQPSRLLARTWLGACASCNSSRESARIPPPSRLIEIQMPAFQGPPTLKLVAGSVVDGAEQRPYVALTHRWPPEDQMKTRLLTSNLAGFHHDIPLQSLPAVFQEAIFLARDLDFAYIWIDALCIIQDSRDDWAYEASRMKDVYKGCAMNVSAVAAAGDPNNASLYVERNPLAASAFVAAVDWPLRTGTFCFVPRDLKTAVESAELNKRGWVFQERFLSPQTMSFAANLFWECPHRNWCEAFPRGLPPLTSFDGSFKLQLELVKGSDLYDTWQGLVESYSQCGLTKDADRLPALAGVAMELSSLHHGHGGRYLAGLWEGDFVEELTWYVDDAKNRAGSGRDGDNLPSPSWSWASASTAVRFATQVWRGSGGVQDTLTLCHLEDAGVQLEDARYTYGLVRRGTASIRGLLYEVSASLVWSYDEKRRGDNGLVLFRYAKEATVRMDWPRPAISTDRLYMMPSLATKVPYDSSSDQLQIFCLILKATIASSLTTFQKVGLAMLSGELIQHDNIEFATGKDIIIGACLGERIICIE